MVRTKRQAKAGYLSKKYKGMIRREKKGKKAAKKSKKKEPSSFIPEPRSFIPEPRDVGLGAMMRNQQNINNKYAEGNMQNIEKIVNNSAGGNNVDKNFANMMRRQQNRVSREGIGIFRRVKKTPSRAHGMKKGKGKGAKKQSKKGKGSRRGRK